MNNFFTHPMRIFFITACFFGILGGLTFFTNANFIILHQMFFLNLLPACAYGGFLLTAIPDWTNFKGNIKNISSVLFVLIAFAFLSLPFSYIISGTFIAVFWAVLLGFCAVLLWRDKNDGNFSILMILSLLLGLQIAFILKNDFKFLYSQIHISVAAIAVVSFRVSMVLGNEALKLTDFKDPMFLPNLVHKNLVSFFAILYAFTYIFFDEKTSGFVALGVGFVMFAKLKELHYFALLKRYYIAFYYLFEFSCAFGYIWLGYLQINQIYNSAPLHLIALGYYFSIILFIFIVAGIRHSGFVKLEFPFFGILALFFMIFSAVIRSFLTEFSGYIHLSAFLLILSFGFYASAFFRIFTRNPFSDDPE